MKKWSWTLAWFTKLASGSRPASLPSKQKRACRGTQQVHARHSRKGPVHAQIRTNSACEILRKIACLPARLRCYHCPSVLHSTPAGGSNRQAATSKQTGMNAAHLSELMMKLPNRSCVVVVPPILPANHACVLQSCSSVPCSCRSLTGKQAS